MTGRNTDRNKKKEKTDGNNFLPAELFVLPDSLPTSEIDFPVIITKGRPKAKWSEIIAESEAFQQSLAEYRNSKEPVHRCLFLNTESDYIKREVFTQLMPAIEQTLLKARVWQAYEKPTCFFNGVDHIAQLLWNNNARYPWRKKSNLHIFNMPWARKILKEKPRPLYPKSWLWPEDYAATIIQKSVRQFFVQKEDDVQEMRGFWQKLLLERLHPDIHTNPFLAKEFASTMKKNENAKRIQQQKLDQQKLQEQQDQPPKPDPSRRKSKRY